MTLLFNLLLPAIILLIGAVGYQAAKKSKNKISTYSKTLAFMVGSVVVYSTIQPSYLPKGETPHLSKMPFEQVELTADDRLLKPKTEAERQAKVDSLLTAKDEIKEVLSKKKEQ